MAYVRVEQRNARLAAGVRLDVVQGKDGLISKGTAVAISNVKKLGEEEATSIQWTFWGKVAESAAEYLGKGSRVNIVGRVQNNNYTNACRLSDASRRSFATVCGHAPLTSSSRALAMPPRASV